MASLTRIISDDEFGIVLLRKSGRSRGLSIRVRTRSTREGARVTVSMPVSLVPLRLILSLVLLR